MSSFSRRKLITTAVAATAGVSGLAAAARIAERYGLIPPDHGGIYGPGKVLTYASHRLLTRDIFAREFIGVGTEEPECFKQGLKNLHTSLKEASIEHVFSESPGTDHEWQTWRRNLLDFAPRLFQTTGRKPVPARRR